LPVIHEFMSNRCSFMLIHRRVRRYQYEMMGVVYPQYAEKNILIDYGVIEEAE
jgi:hypothetical protein